MQKRYKIAFTKNKYIERRSQIGKECDELFLGDYSGKT